MSDLHFMFGDVTNDIPFSFYVVQVCKHFLDAVERKQYGWFWTCPNGGKECHYRHALPPGYVLKSQMKALLEEEGEKLTIEEEIENQVCCRFTNNGQFFFSHKSLLSYSLLPGACGLSQGNRNWNKPI